MSPKPTFRMTRQRRVILEEVHAADSHPTADDVYQRARLELPRVSLGTVYRNLDLLCQQGLIQKLELAAAQRRFDRNTQKHYHVRCIRCGRMEDAPVQPIAGIEEAVEAATSYEVVGHRLKFVGVCPECRQEPRSEAR